MPDSTLIGLLTGSGVAGVFCVLFIAGWIYPRPVVTAKDAEIAELKAAVKAERDRADTAVAAAEATKTLMTAIQYGQMLGPPHIPAGGR